MDIIHKNVLYKDLKIKHLSSYYIIIAVKIISTTSLEVINLTELLILFDIYKFVISMSFSE